MAEINARALMFNLGREDAIDSTTSAKIARYAERKQLAYKLTDEGVLLLDGRGKKIHLRNGVVTLRNALGLHALPERCHAIGDNRVFYYEIEKHPIPSDGSSSPTKCAPPTYPWNWSATSQGDYTCRRNAVNGLRRNVPRKRRCRNGRLYKFPIRSVRPSVIVLSLSWSGGDRNYTDTTTILNASEVTVALPLYGE